MPDPADLSLRARLAEALRTAPSVVLDTPEERARHAESERNHHVTHNYYYGCAVCRGEVDTLAEAAAAVVQHELESLEQQAGNARWAAIQSDQRATNAEFALEKWDDLRAEVHEQMRAGFAEMIRSKWDSEMAPPDADMAADACIDYLENEFAGQLARALTTNQRLNRRCQQAESNLATIARAVSEWRLGPGGTYVPLQTLNAIAKAVGRQVDETKFELHHQHVERLERERDAAVVQLGRNIPLICSDERHQAKVTALEAELAQALAEIERLRDDLAADDLYADGPPLRPITELPDIATHKEV